MTKKFIGYGSLMSHASLKKTIKDKDFIPIIVKGYKRIFNVELTTGGKTNALNVIKNRKSEFNGVMFSINNEELKKIKKRENGYNFEIVKIYDFKTGKNIGKAMVSTIDLKDCDKKNQKPNKKYFKLCRSAAYEISKEFGKTWDETTYTSEGKKVREIKELPNYIKQR